MAAIVKSHSKIPIIIAQLYSMSSFVLEEAAVLARIEPYIPSQKRMVNGLDTDMKKPDINDLKRESSAFFRLVVILPALRTLSIPVYVRTKQPNSHRNVFIKDVFKKWATPR